MIRSIAILALLASTWGIVGCGNSDQPKTDKQEKTIKAPDSPPDEV